MYACGSPKQIRSRSIDVWDVRCMYVCITEMDGLDAEYTDTDTDTDINTDNRAGARLAGEGFELLPLH